MKKSFKRTFIMLLIFTFTFPITYAYAIDKSEIFFEISKLEVTKNEKVEMTLNFDKIEYNKFLFELESSEDLQDIQVLDSEDNLDVEQDNNEITFEIDKENTNLTNITLYYQIPEDVQVNDVIKFVATITNLENNENEDAEVETQTLEFKVKIIEVEDENIEETEEVQKPDVESEDNNIEENVQMPNKEQDETNIDNNQIQEMEQSNAQKISNNSSYSVQQISNTTVLMTDNSKSIQETGTYNGSDNNYLSELSINGYTLNKEFSKDNSTYFVTVENDVDFLEIIATAENSSSIVCVYGNESLIEGINKILISVTAENGNVRNYRIYVTKNA